MHKVMVEENKKLKQKGQPLLARPPKPCDHFDLIGGTSTGGCASCFKHNVLLLIFLPYRIIALMLGRLRMDVETAIQHYDTVVKLVFSHPKGRPGDGKFKATKLEAAIKSIVKGVTGDSESPLLERNVFTGCRT